MNKTFILLCFFTISFVRGGIDIPGCGELQNIKWNNSCLLSSTKFLQSSDKVVLSVKNLLLIDGVLYYIVPPKQSDDFKERVNRQIWEMMTRETQLQVVDIANSPLKFKESGGEFVVKEVKNREVGVVFQRENMRVFSNPQFEGKSFSYISFGHLYHMMTRVFKNFEVNQNSRNSTIFLTTIQKQARIDWESGANINCFSSDGLLHVKATKHVKNTLYILRHVIFYLPRHNTRNELKIQKLPQDVFDYCKNNGYAYDSSGDIQDRKKYNVSIGTLFKNEAQYLLEWIAYHTIVGIEHFYLFNDESTDESLEVLQPLVDQNLVTIFDSSNTFLDTRPGFQTSFLIFLSDKYSLETKWFLSIDVDEFLVIKDPKYDNNINEFIKQNQPMRSDTGSLQIGREAFAGNYDPILKSQLVTNKLIRKLIANFSTDATLGKSLVSTNGIDNFQVHFGYSFAPMRNVLMQKNCSNPQDCAVAGPLSIYHYVVKNYDRCIAKIKSVKLGFWRAKQGETFCERMVSKYAPEKWISDFTLANTTKQICQRMKLLNEKWYNQHQICQDY